jgi:hypothetical protein
VVVVSDFIGGEFSPFGDKLFWERKEKFAFAHKLQIELGREGKSSQ